MEANGRVIPKVILSELEDGRGGVKEVGLPMVTEILAALAKEGDLGWQPTIGTVFLYKQPIT